MKNINRFFIEENAEGAVSVEEIKHCDYLHAFTRATNKSVYIIDVYKKTFEYVSDHPLFLCGHTPQEVLELGYDFYHRNVRKEDLNLLQKVKNVWLQFYEHLPVSDRQQYTISCDFHLDFFGRSILVNQKSTPLLLSPEGKVQKAMCIVSLACTPKSGNIQIHRHGSNIMWTYDETEDRWKEGKKEYLTVREALLLAYASQGLSVNEIAEKMFLSPDTIKFHRKKMFEKLNVPNITQALAVATERKLI